MTHAGNFQLLARATGDGDIEVQFYKSSTTGMTVAIVGVEGPLVNGYFCVATETHDDDGLPNALAHLIFSGSDDYPFKGALNKMANRCSSDQKTSVQTDHTYYELSTISRDGFLNLLPVYLDHILFPKLTDAAFTTEVHHINAKGEDAGVVYSERKKLENTSENLIDSKMLQLMYPGRCEYNLNIYGTMKNLRESTTNEKVRAYHSAYYRPENLCVIICGEVEPVAVFKSLQPFESKIIGRRNPEPFERPWQTPVEPLLKSVETTIQFPSDDDNNGIVSIAWRGPLVGKEYEVLIALDVLLDYFTDSAIAPLQQEFVEFDDSFCSGISTTIIENYESCIEMRFQGIEKEKLQTIKKILFEVFGEIGNKQTPIYMDRMVNVIHRKKMQHLSSLETAPHDLLANKVIDYFIYGNKLEDLFIRIRQNFVLDQLMEKDEQFWIDLLNRYFLGDAKHVVIVAEPSWEMHVDLTKEEEERIENQCKALGEKGLKQKGIDLEEANKNNQIKLSDSIIQSVPAPEVNNIHFHSINRINNYYNNISHVPEFLCLNKLPFRFQLDDIKTNFVTMRVLMDTTNCLSYQRLFLPLWSQLVMESQILRDGLVVSYEDVVQDLYNDTIDNSFSIGLDEKASFGQVVFLMVKVELDKFEKGLRWLSELMYSTQFTVERIRTMAKRMIKETGQVIREGDRVAWTMIKSMCFQPESNHWAVGFVRQHIFLKVLLEKLESSPEEVIKELERIRFMITNIANLTVHMSANVSFLYEKYPNTGQLLIERFLLANVRNEPKVVPCFGYLVKENSFVHSMFPRNSFAGIGLVESNFLLQCVESINSWTHTDLAPLLVLLQYLTKSEVLFKTSLNCDMFLCISQGLLYFKLFTGTHLIWYYKNIMDILLDYLNDKEPYQQSLLESAQSSLIYGLIQREKSVEDLSYESMSNYLRGVDINYNKELINSILRVSISDLKRVALVYLLPLFDPTKSRISICCPPSKVAKTVNAFKELGFELNKINIEGENFMSRKYGFLFD